EAGVGDGEAGEAQLAELGQLLDVLQSGVADLGAIEVEFEEIGEDIDALERGVGGLGPGQGDSRDRTAFFLADIGLAANLLDVGDELLLVLVVGERRCGEQEQASKQGRQRQGVPFHGVLLSARRGAPINRNWFPSCTAGTGKSIAKKDDLPRTPLRYT